MEVRKAIIIGASTGIGRELAKILVQSNYILGLTARRMELLADLQREILVKTYARKMDVTKTDEALLILEDLINEMNGLDLMIVNAGIGFINPGLEWQKERQTIETNVAGFAAMVNGAYKHFVKQGYGHIVGVSSIAALLGSADAPAYNASKAFISNYMRGIRQKINRAKVPIVITEVQPGFVDTALAVSDRIFWMASAQKAACQIYDAIRLKKKHVYITRRWRLIAWLLKIIPDWVLDG